MVGSLDVHMSRHKGKRSFKSDSCEKSFLRKTDLTKHMLLHRPKQFICGDCGASFRHKQALDVHGRLHCGDWPHSCPQCGQTFTDSSTLKGHLIIHTDTKAHVCSVCRKAYKYLKTLKQHMRVHTSAISKPFSRLLRKSKVDVVVTDSDAKVVGVSDASKTSNVKVKAHSNLPGENLPKLASGSIKFTNPSKLTVTASETSNGSLTLNSSLCTTGITSLSSADLSSNIVSVCDPSESSSQIFSPSTDLQNSFPLSNLQVCNGNIDSTKRSPPSKPWKALSVNRNTKKKIIPFKPPHKMCQTILNPKTIPTNQTVHQTHNKQWELSLTHKMILILIKSPHPWSTVTKFSSSYNAVLTGECGELFCPRPCYCNPWSFKQGTRVDNHWPWRTGPESKIIFAWVVSCSHADPGTEPGDWHSHHHGNLGLETDTHIIIRET